MKRAPKIECKLCGRKVTDTQEMKLEHMYYYHPAMAIQKIIGSAPVLQQLGNAFGEAIRKAIAK
jgi:hypothetical protein